MEVFFVGLFHDGILLLTNYVLHARVLCITNVFAEEETWMLVKLLETSS